MSLLSTPPDAKWLACVDFGTAFSKICIVRRHAGMTTAEHVLPLAIGPKTISQASSTPLAPSCLYILTDRVYFGDRALEVSAQHNDPSRERFESPKHILSEMTAGALDVPPPIRQDPTQSLTRGDLMALLLAQLIWRASTAARRIGLKSLPKLRFARPAWKAEYATRGEQQLLRLFAKAFVIAGTLRDELASADGVRLSQVRATLDLFRDEEDFVEQLKRRVELGPDQKDPIDRGFVPEATAVAIAAIRPERGLQRIFVVVDVGAGTTDFGAFVTVPGQGEGVIGELRRGRRIVLRAGNFLDEQVVALLKEKVGLVEGMPSSIAPMARLRREAPRIKEELFTQGEVNEDLGNGQFVRASVTEFLDRRPVQDFAEELWRQFSETLEAAVGFTRGLTLAPSSIEVIFTGGGGKLPMVRDLLTRADQTSQYPVTLTDPMPPWAAGTNWSQVFPQLAVAIGGAMPVMPQQR